jgi:predicted transcriptional regulator of viral defense system
MPKKKRNGPSWPALYEIAAGQAGYFRAKQAADAGFSSQLLRSHVLAGKLVHPRRGIYRLVQFPVAENEDLMELWLWSEEEGVFSHETALALHDLSDVLPSRIHMTVPHAWRERSRSRPEILVVHYADVPASERTWVGSVPVTTPERTLRDAFDGGTNPGIVAQAVRDGVARGLFTRADLRGIVPPRIGRPRLKPRSAA